MGLFGTELVAIIPFRSKLFDRKGKAVSGAASLGCCQGRRCSGMVFVAEACEGIEAAELGPFEV